MFPKRLINESFEMPVFDVARGGKETIAENIFIDSELDEGNSGIGNRGQL